MNNFSKAALILTCIASLHAVAHEPETAPGAALATGEIVEFHIANGTGNRPWNDLATAVNVKVGQTLLLINDDVVPHYLHTPDAPCLHGDNAFGGDPSAPIEARSYACQVISEADPQSTILYDHGFGRTARFYVRAVE